MRDPPTTARLARPEESGQHSWPEKQVLVPVADTACSGTTVHHERSDLGRDEVDRHPGSTWRYTARENEGMGAGPAARVADDATISVGALIEPLHIK